MRDSQKAMFLGMLGLAVTVLGLILFAILAAPVSIEPEYLPIIFSLLLGGILYTVIFRFHPRVQHYMEAQDEFDRNYRYEKEAQ